MVVEVEKPKYCKVCGNHNVSNFWSYLNRGRYYSQYFCSYKCYSSANRYLMLIISIVWSIFVLLVSFFVIKNFSRFLSGSIYLFEPFGLIFLIEAVLIYQTLYGFKVKIQKYEDGGKEPYPLSELSEYEIPNNEGGIICPQCNSHIKNDKIFCPFCGNKFERFQGNRDL